MTRLVRYLRYAIHGETTHPRRKPRRRAVKRGPARSAKYMAWIRTFPCEACGTDQMIEAAHTGSDGGMALKASDLTCVSLCWGCHRGNPRSYHAIGRERFEELWGIEFREIVARRNAEWWAMRAGRAV